MTGGQCGITGRSPEAAVVATLAAVDACSTTAANNSVILDIMDSVGTPETEPETAVSSGGPYRTETASIIWAVTSPTSNKYR